MPKIIGFSTLSKNWQKDVVNAVSKNGGSISFPFEAEKMICEKDPFLEMDKRALQTRGGKALSYTVGK